MKMVFDQRIAVDRLTCDVEHGKQDFVRQAAKAIARELVERSCVIVDTQYDIERLMYRSTARVLFARKERVLP